MSHGQEPLQSPPNSRSTTCVDALHLHIAAFVGDGLPLLLVGLAGPGVGFDPFLNQAEELAVGLRFGGIPNVGELLSYLGNIADPFPLSTGHVVWFRELALAFQLPSFPVGTHSAAFRAGVSGHLLGDGGVLHIGLVGVGASSRPNINRDFDLDEVMASSVEVPFLSVVLLELATQ